MHVSVGQERSYVTRQPSAGSVGVRTSVSPDTSNTRVKFCPMIAHQ